jgi:hypothetical protein
MAAKPRRLSISLWASSPPPTFRRVVSTARPGFRPGVITEETRSYALRVCRAREARRALVPPRRAARRISHHLDSFLRSQWNAAGSLHASTTRAGYRDFTGENREKSLRYSKVVDSAQLPPIAGTAGPKRLHCFLECTGPRRNFRLKLSARQALLPHTLLWVTFLVGRLVWGTCPIQPRHTSPCALSQPSCRAHVTRFLASRGGDSHSLIMLSGLSVLPRDPFRVRTSSAGGLPADMG